MCASATANAAFRVSEGHSTYVAFLFTNLTVQQFIFFPEMVGNCTGGTPVSYRPNFLRSSCKLRARVQYGAVLRTVPETFFTPQEQIFTKYSQVFARGLPKVCHVVALLGYGKFTHPLKDDAPFACTISSLAFL